MSDHAAAVDPIGRRKTYELVADRLIAQISSRRLKPGDALPPERELVESYAVGRSSVREALRMLESKGLIESRGNGAFAVATLRNPLNHSLGLLLAVEEGDLHELFEVRRILEAEAAALAATRRTRDELERMTAATDAMAAGLASRDRFIEADLRFHLTIADATRNRFVSHLMHAIRDQLHRALGSIYRIPGSADRSIDDHRRIVEAVAAEDAQAARHRMHEHLTRVEHDVLRAERTSGAGADGRPQRRRR